MTTPMHWSPPHQEIHFLPAQSPMMQTSMEVHSPIKKWMTEFLPNTIQLENWPGNY